MAISGRQLRFRRQLPHDAARPCEIAPQGHFLAMTNLWLSPFYRQPVLIAADAPGPAVPSYHPITAPHTVPAASAPCPGMCHNTAPSRRAAAPHSTGRASGSGSRHSAPEHRRSIPRPPRWTAQRHNTPRCARGRPASAAASRRGTRGRPSAPRSRPACRAPGRRPS